jgi:hypothetical protein
VVVWRCDQAAGALPQPRVAGGAGGGDLLEQMRSRGDGAGGGGEAES